MSYSLTYKTLFEIDVLHDCYLNSGTDAFGSMSQETQSTMLRNYAFQSFIEIVPTAATRAILEDQRMLFRSDSKSLKILVTTTPADQFLPLIPINDNLELKFLVKIRDPFFENYTDLTFVKNELFVFSNVKPTGAPTGFPFIKLSTDPGPVTNNFRMSTGISENLVKNIPVEERIGLFGLLLLRMHGQTGTDYDIPQISATPGVAARVRTTPLRFEIEFANRSTIWKYYFKNSQYYAETTTAKPLTKNGYLEITPAALVLKHTDPDVVVDPDDIDLESYYYPAPDVRRIEGTSGNFNSVIYI